jgi:hypothetical protein
MESTWVDLLGFAFLVLLLYVLSIGPVLKIVGGPFNMTPGLRTFYHPLSVVLWQDGKSAYVLRWYIDLCGTHNRPSTGELQP